MSRLASLVSKLFSNPAVRCALRLALPSKAHQRERRVLRLLELLEERTLLSSVIGTLYDDISNDGLTPDDPLLSGWTVQIAEESSVAIFVADFSDDAGGPSLDGFSATGVWHASNACDSDLPIHTAPEIAYFRVDATCNFDQGHQAGDLTSPLISLPPNARYELTFNHRLDAEGNPDFDAATVEVAVNGGPFQGVLAKPDGTLPLTS